MNEIIEKLLKIQTLDQQITELVVERDKRPAALAREQGAVAAGQAKVEEAERRHKAAQVEVDRLNRILQGREEKIRKHEQAMLAPKIGNKEYKAIQNGIADIRAENELTEEEILLAMETVDTRSDEVAAALEELRGHEKGLEEARRRVENEVGVFDGQIDELRAEKDGHVAGLAIESRQVYERVHEALGASVVAQVVDGFCQGCYMQVTTQEIALILKAERLRQCKTCQRILYVPNPEALIGGG
jgi:predicted  nucleic acid-binding Zn-ribbon protein